MAFLFGYAYTLVRVHRCIVTLYHLSLSLILEHSLIPWPRHVSGHWQLDICHCHVGHVIVRLDFFLGQYLSSQHAANFDYWRHAFPDSRITTWQICLCNNQSAITIMSLQHSGSGNNNITSHHVLCAHSYIMSGNWELVAHHNPFTQITLN